MRLIDNINYRFGYGKIRLSSDSNVNFFHKVKMIKAEISLGR